jgi:hypothetical protein
LRRIGDEGKAADHFVFDDVIDRSAGCGSALFGGHFIIVAVIGASIACEFIAFAVRLGREFAKRAILPPA